MIQGRIPELTIKFTERPQNLPEEGKKVVIEVKGENKITVKAEVNRKSLKKVVGKMDTWNNWVASLSGKMKSISLRLCRLQHTQHKPDMRLTLCICSTT